MHDFRCKHADEMKYNVLSRKVRSLKETDEGVDSMCKAVEEYGMELKEEGRAEGRVEGRVEGKAEGKAEERADIIARMKASGMTDEQIEKVLSTKV